MISPDITVARLLDEHPELVEVLASYHPHFKQLRNRLLRRVMAPRVTIAQAARIAGVPTDDLLATLRRAVGEREAGSTTPHPALSPEGRGNDHTAGERGHPDSPSRPQGETRGDGPKPEVLSTAPASRQVHLDVREDIGRGEEPFARIMAAVKGLGLEEVLVLRAPFEPIPLYDVLGKRGFAHWTECHGREDWSVWFYRQAGGTVTRQEESAPTISAESLSRVIDVRGLEPPQPMVRVLKELERLGPGQHLEVLHERRPLFLYPQLDERGFIHETDEPQPGLVRIVIRRGASAG